MRLPAATYRLQLRGGLDLGDATGLVPYLDRLGVSHLYLSPVATAVPGSNHGYDVVDPGAVDPALGGEQALAALAAELADRGMGLIVDVVPNHMAAMHANPWWHDVLARGQASPCAPLFDIDWDPPRRDLAGKVLLPVLGRRYGEALAAGELRALAGPAATGPAVASPAGTDPGLAGPEVAGPAVTGPAVTGPAVAYYEHRFPLAGAGPEELAAARRSPAALHRLLQRQSYRLAFWRPGLREVNYRRFFDVASLVGVRVEDPAVFAAVHAGLLRWAAAGWIHGVRVDHIDGLRDPAGYLRRLAATLPAATPVWVEKVLAPDEELPAAWPCAGTTGYEFAAAAAALLYDGRGAAALDRLGARCGIPRRPYAEVLREAKREVLRDLFAAEVAALCRSLAGLAAEDAAGADLGVDELGRALVELTAWLPVYRTYAEEGERAADRGPLAAADRGPLAAAACGPLAAAAAGAARTLAAADGPAAAFVARVLAVRSPADAGCGAWGDAAARWRQLSGPAMAKGGEDTALYRHVRLTSLNEVGGDPDTAGLTVGGFHAWCARRLAGRPAALSATSTHDTKRGEDVRARIHVLAELAALWSRHCLRWRDALGPAWTGIDPALAMLLLQAAAGAWPLAAAELPAFAERLAAYALKAAREARRFTSWLCPDPAYEARVAAFVDALFASGPFLADFVPVQRLIAYYGAVNSLAQVVLKAACPGVPDLYQGCESWDLNLVDPDNRRPVDFARLSSALAELDAGAQDPTALLRAWPDGRIKLWVTARALRFRRAHARLFAEGAYVPVPVRGRQARHLCCFVRHAGREWALVAVSRFPARLAGADRTGRATPPLGAVWGATRLVLPAGAPSQWRSVLTGARVAQPAAAALLADLPVALLEGCGS